MNTISLSKYKFEVPEIKYILLMFFSTRIMLAIIGLLSHKLSGSDPEGFTGYSWLNLWGHWDTGWYLNIAQNGYTAKLIAQQTNIVFFPLYPLLMRFLGFFTGNHYIAGVMISNFCLIVSCIYLYRLVKLDSDEANAIKSIKYLLIFPISFILSGCFSESLYLLLTLMCFYYARTSKWQLAGIAGFFLSLTKSMGVLVLLPLLYEGLVPLLKENKDLKNSKNSKGKKENKDSKIFEKSMAKIMPLFYLLLIPLGTISYMIYNYYLTGDFLAFVHGQEMWQRHAANPLLVLINNGYHGSIYSVFEAAFATFFIFIFIFFYRKIRFSYLLFILYSIFVPLSTGIMSMPRYILVIFPIYILFSEITKEQVSEDIVTVGFALLQGFLMLFWIHNTWLVV